MRSTRQITVIGKRVTARTLCATTDKWESCRISAHWKLLGSVQEAASDREACMLIRVADLTLSVAEHAMRMRDEAQWQKASKALVHGATADRSLMLTPGPFATASDRTLTE
jgi:hypothetical protein